MNGPSQCDAGDESVTLPIFSRVHCRLRGDRLMVCVLCRVRGVRFWEEKGGWVCTLWARSTSIVDVRDDSVLCAVFSAALPMGVKCRMSGARELPQCVRRAHMFS